MVSLKQVNKKISKSLMIITFESFILKVNEENLQYIVKIDW